MIWFLIQLAILSSTWNRYRYGFPVDLLVGGWILFDILWLASRRWPTLEPGSKYFFSAWLGWVPLLLCVEGPLRAYSLVWPTLWLRLGWPEVRPTSARASLIGGQLVLAAGCPSISPMWIFCRLNVSLASLCQLRPGRLARAANTAALVSGLGPALQAYFFPEVGVPWMEPLGMAAFLLLPQLLLRRHDRAGTLVGFLEAPNRCLQAQPTVHRPVPCSLPQQNKGQ